MNQEHLRQLNLYYENSKVVYDFLLGGAKHLGYHPGGKKIPENAARIFMHEVIAQKLSIRALDRVLDAGCGQGVVANYIAKQYCARIIGNTVVPFEASRALKLSRQLNILERVHFFLMDYTEMGFRDESFDAVYSIESLVHSTNLTQTLKEIHRVLKSKGRVSLFEYCLSDAHLLSDDEWKTLNAVAVTSAMVSLKEFRIENVRRILTEIGFENIDVQDITNNVAPSVYRLRSYFLVPYWLVRLLNWQERFPNLTGIVEFARMGEKGLFRYKIFSATKR